MEAELTLQQTVLVTETIIALCSVCTMSCNLLHCRVGMMSLPLIFMILLMQTVAYNAVNLSAVFSQCGPILDLWST